MDLKSLRLELNRDIAKRKHAYATIQEEAKRVEIAQAYLDAAVDAQQRFQVLAQERQAHAHKNIAKIVSKCLETVFEDPYELQIEFVRMRGKTDARLVYLKGGNEVNPLLTSGGVLDISALALRISSLVLAAPQPRKLLILDEPFTGVSAKNLPKVGSLIVTLAKEMKMQFLIVTHSELLQIGKVIEI